MFKLHFGRNNHFAELGGQGHSTLSSSHCFFLFQKIKMHLSWKKKTTHFCAVLCQRWDQKMSRSSWEEEVSEANKEEVLTVLCWFWLRTGLSLLIIKSHLQQTDSPPGLPLLRGPFNSFSLHRNCIKNVNAFLHRSRTNLTVLLNVKKTNKPYCEPSLFTAPPSSLQLNNLCGIYESGGLDK